MQLVVLFLCTHIKDPTKSDKRKLDRVIGFLKRTKERKRRICGTGDLRALKGYIDSAVSAHDDEKVILVW